MVIISLSGIMPNVHDFYHVIELTFSGKKECYEIYIAIIKVRVMIGVGVNIRVLTLTLVLNPMYPKII